MIGPRRIEVRPLLAIAAAATVAAWAPSPAVPAAGAQVSSSAVGTRQASDPGWLGVGLISLTECRRGAGATEDECGRTLVVGGLVHGGPAERAGLQPGDTLLAMDGDRLTEGAEDPAFRRVSPGDTVSILVGRPGGRVQIRAVPATRPDSLAIVQYHRDGAYVEDRARYLLAVPRRPLLDSLVAAAVRDPNLSVETRVSVIPADRVNETPLRTRPGAVAAAPAPAREQVAELQARARELRREAVAEAQEIRREMNAAPRGERAEAGRAAAEEWKRWISEELRPRLQVIYDSVLAEARDRMDSLQSLYPAAAAAARAAARAADTLSAPPSPPRDPPPVAPDAPEGWGMPANRIAGAQLQPLNPQLGEFFGGVERGLVVLRVLPGTPAQRLGLRPGDVIVEAAGHRVTAVEGLRHYLSERGSGTEVRWVRRGELMADTLRH